MKINVIGLGHVGLPTAILMSNDKNTVFGTDIDTDLISKLNNTTLEIQDHNLRSRYYNVLNKKLFFITHPCIADIHIIAVPTPFISSSKKVDLTHLDDVLEQLINLEQDDFLIVIESTVSPGTINQLKKKFNQSKKKLVFAHSPERVLPGDTFNEMVYNSRTIGTDDVATFEQIRSIYQTFVKGNIIHTDILTAELSKVIENTYRDVNIALANEIAIICRRLKTEPNEVIKIANYHPRVNILSPGPGVGGHCIPVDPWFLVGDFPQDARLIKSARTVNDAMPEYIKTRIIEIIEANHLSLRDIGLYGLTYKANVKDFRNSPSLKILEIFKATFNLELNSFDPFNYSKEEIDIEFNKFLNASKLIVILVDHSHLLENLEHVKDKIVFDTKNFTKLEGVIYL